MPTVKVAACGARFSRLDTDGTPVYDSATGAVTVPVGIMSFKFSYEREEGAEIFKKDSCGVPLISIKQDDIIKRVNWELVLGQDDYIMYEITDLAELIVDGSDVVGMSVPLAAGCEAGSGRNPFALEVWSQQFVCAAAYSRPYQRIILPYNTAVPTEETRETDPSEPTFEGSGRANPNFGDGPFGDLDLLDTESAADKGIHFLDDDSVPEAPEDGGYSETPPEAS
jgi:hypothetical protein